MDDHRTEGSELSETPESSTLRAQLSGRWQIPLLVLSCALLGMAVWRLRPEPKPPSFEEHYAHAVQLRDDARYPEASAYIAELLADPERKPEERPPLHRLMAEVIFAHERGNTVHGEKNLARFFEHSDKSLAPGESHSPDMHVMRATAYEWLRRPADAIREHQAAIPQVQGRRAWALRKRVIELQQSMRALSPEALEAECDAFMQADDIDDELRYWAAEQKIELFAQAGEHEAADRFLVANAARFAAPALQRPYRYLQALAWYRVGRLDEAERGLRIVRDQLVPGDPLYARTGWLLGKVLQSLEAPEFALGFFDDVIARTTPGPYRTASVLGRAETLAALERFDESIAAYQEVLRLTTERPYGSLVDLQVVRESTTVLYQALLTQGQLASAMEFLRIAARLAPPSDSSAQVLYARRLADLAMALGKAALGRSDDPDAGATARRYLTEAGEQYLTLAKLAVMNEDESTAATWQAADAFDLAGRRAQTAEVLEAFLEHHGDSPRAPMALLRLGQTYQAGAQYEKAITWYQRNLTEFPRTPAAISSLVPLADCFLAIGDVDKAEATLLRIVTRNPDDPISLITPAAGEYRDALFRLGDLYVRAGAYEKAIARYEEAVERYVDDPRSDRAVYMLADAHRQSAAQILADLADPRHAAVHEELRATRIRRLHRSRELYDETIRRFEARAARSADELDELYVRLSHFYRADVACDLAHDGDGADPRGLAEAIELYDRAAWLYQQDPMALNAYVKMISCHLRLGQVDEARMTLQRARWAMKGISDAAFLRHAPQEDRAFWETYLNWLESTPTLAGAPAAAEAGNS